MRIDPAQCFDIYWRSFFLRTGEFMPSDKTGKCSTQMLRGKCEILKRDYHNQRTIPVFLHVTYRLLC